MISKAAKDSLSTLFQQAIKETLDLENNPHQWELQPLEGYSKVRAKEFIILTICCYDFRLLATLHFTYNRPTLHYVSESLQLPVGQVDRTRFDDYLGEYCNHYCGIIKRTLGSIFPHLGMSTPEKLKEESALYFQNLEYEYAMYSLASSKNKVHFSFGLFICPAGDLDFTILRKAYSAKAEEIEFF